MIDPLSEVLRSVRLTGGIFLDARFTAPWSVHTQIVAEDCVTFAVKPSLLIAYHFVIAGKFLLSVDSEPTVEVRAGEIVLLPRNDVHTLASDAGLVPTNARHLIQPSPDGGLAKIMHGGGGEPAQIVCGFLGSEETYNPLIAALPRVLKLDIREGVARDWIEASVRYAAGELTAGRFASSNLMSRLSELLFVEAMRQYSVTYTDQDGGWLKGIADPKIGRALASIHHNVGLPWSAEVPCERSLDVAERLRRPLHNPDRGATNPVSDHLAASGSQGEPTRNTQADRPNRRGSGLRIRRSIQPGIRPGACAMAATLTKQLIAQASSFRTSLHRGTIRK
ncbi:hypothetical protein ACVWZK_003745 [Bradyrhizobium sp. GM0.4]